MIRPIQDRVICKKVDADIHSSGLIIPGIAKDEGKVVAVGPGRKLANGIRPMSIEPHDTIIFPATRGQAFVYDETEFVVLNEEHAIAKIVHGKLVPLNDFCIAELDTSERKVGKIVIADRPDDRDEATLIAVGPGKIKDDGTLEPMQLRPGDRVLYNKRMGDEIHRGNTPLTAFREEHVVCITNRA